MTPPDQEPRDSEVDARLDALEASALAHDAEIERLGKRVEDINRRLRLDTKAGAE